MSLKLYESLKKYKKLNRSSFHTPGHKCQKLVSGDLFALDFTELPLTDSLYEASGIIAGAEKSLSELYGTKKSLFSSGGNTLCIQAMLRLCAPCGGKILCDRVVHRSAVSAMALLEIEPIWIRRNIGVNSGLPEMLDVSEIEQAFNNNDNILGVYITSPSYYGILQNIDEISRLCKRRGAALMVDNAHGTHLMFTPENMHPVVHGADMCADSAHKTMPVLTGGAWLHINNSKFCEDAKNAMALFGSTSPSYPVMASMDICVNRLKKSGSENWKKLCRRTANILKEASEKGIFVLPDNICDPARITLGVWAIGYSGYEFAEYLYKFKIEPEFCDDIYAVLIPTPFNTKQDWARLKAAIKNISAKSKKNFGYESMDLPETAVTLRKALTMPRQKVSLREALGKIAAEIACPCPPGIPVVMPGEIISRREILKLERYGFSEIYVLK